MNVYTVKEDFRIMPNDGPGLSLSREEARYVCDKLAALLGPTDPATLCQQAGAGLVVGQTYKVRDLPVGSTYRLVRWAHTELTWKRDERDDTDHEDNLCCSDAILLALPAEAAKPADVAAKAEPMKLEVGQRYRVCDLPIGATVYHVDYDSGVVVITDPRPGDVTFADGTHDYDDTLVALVALPAKAEAPNWPPDAELTAKQREEVAKMVDKAIDAFFWQLRMKVDGGELFIERQKSLTSDNYEEHPELACSDILRAALGDTK